MECRSFVSVLRSSPYGLVEVEGIPPMDILALEGIATRGSFRSLVLSCTLQLSRIGNLRMHNRSTFVQGLHVPRQSSVSERVGCASCGESAYFSGSQIKRLLFSHPCVLHCWACPATH
eukprot:4447742-Amphidinium_carterae.1